MQKKYIFLKISIICVGGTRRSGPIHSVFTPDLVLIKLLGCVEFEGYRRLTSHFIRALIIQNVDPLWGRTLMGWTDIVHFRTWPSTDENMRICKVRAKSDYRFSFCAENIVIFFLKISTFCGGGVRSSWAIYSILTPELGFIKILGCAKFEDNRALTSHFIRVVIIQNFDPL